MLEARLKVLGGKHQGKSILLPLGKFLIGRERDCHLRPASESISRHHCAFSVDSYTARLRDLGSRNGTFVNDDRLHGEITLQHGDRVRVGSLEFQMILREVTSPTPASGSGDSQLFGDTAVLSTAETSYELPSSLAAGIAKTQSLPTPKETSQPSAS